MLLDAADAANINRFFTAIRSLNELDQAEIRNVVAGQLNPTLLEKYLTLNYHRAAINIELLLTLTDTKQFQAITGLTRTNFETLVELKLLAIMPNAGEKALLFSNLEKLKSAKRIVNFKKSHPADTTDITTYDAFVARNELTLTSQKQKVWPHAQKLPHWSEMSLEARARYLGSDFEKIYDLYYPLLSWYAHSGVTGLTTLTTEAFAHLCGVCYTIVITCYALTLEIIVDAFRITKADDRLTDKIEFAKIVAFADNDEQAAELRRDMLGE
jgi:hypothetical protein